MEDIRIGDLKVKKSAPSMGGFDVYGSDGRRICFFNDMGAEVLKDWIGENF